MCYRPGFTQTSLRCYRNIVWLESSNSANINVLTPFSAQSDKRLLLIAQFDRAVHVIIFNYQIFKYKTVVSYEPRHEIICIAKKSNKHRTAALPRRLVITLVIRCLYTVCALLFVRSFYPAKICLKFLSIFMLSFFVVSISDYGTGAILSS